MPTEPVKPVTNEPAKLDFSKAEKNIETITEHLKKFEGKPGYNPFMYYNKFVQPIATRYIKGERTPELFKLMTELKPTEPSINLFDEAKFKA